MRPHPRIRKTIKWGGAAVCVLLVAAVAVNQWHAFQWTLTLSDTVHRVMLRRGSLMYMEIEWDLGRRNPTWVGLRFDNEAATRGIDWRPHWASEGRGSLLCCPLWLPFLLVALPTALAWRFDTLATHRLKLGACPTCSYPHTGLAPAAPCPECGAAAPQA